MLLYILAGVLEITGKQPSTAVAQEAARKSVMELKGIIIREETVIPARGFAALPTAADGQAVPAGGEIAVSSAGKTYAPCAGIYVRETDGYEHLTPQMVWELSPADADRLQMQPASPNIGKLITDHSWLLAVTMETEQAARLQTDSHVVFACKEAPDLSLTASVIHISPSEHGKCLAVFRCTEHLSHILHLRELTVLLTETRPEGLRIPAVAVHTDEAGSFVYIRYAHRAEKQYVTVLSEEDDTCIVSKDSSADALRVGDTVILGTPMP